MDNWALLGEIARSSALAPWLERWRTTMAPASLLARLRARGHICPARDTIGRHRLQRAIRFVDRCFPSGPSCYRRALLEIALDAGAATEPLHLGLRSRGGPQSGHAWLASDRGSLERYDAEFVV